MLLQLAAGAPTTDTVHESSETAQTEVVLLTATTDRVDTPEAESDQNSESSQSTTDVLSDIADISLPLRIQKRGRIKGSELTVIGLPIKTLKLQKSKCVAFGRMTNIQKQSFVLSWFVEQYVVDKCITDQHLLQEDEVELNPDQEPVSRSCL